MKLTLAIRKIWNWLPPQTWGEVYAVILTLLLLFLAFVWLIDAIKGALP